MQGETYHHIKIGERVKSFSLKVTDTFEEFVLLIIMRQYGRIESETICDDWEDSKILSKVTALDIRYIINKGR